MKKQITLLLTLTVLINLGCDKESVNPLEKEIEQFKTETIIQFKGKVLNKDIFWKFDNWDNGIGSYSQSFWCVADDKTIQQRIFAIYDYEKREALTYLDIISPAFSIADSYLVKKSIFEIGKKEFHSTDNSIFNGFTVEGSKDGVYCSTSNGNQDRSFFEIIKIQELLSDYPDKIDYKKIRFWVVVTCNLYSYDGQLIGRIESGKFIAEIDIERNG